MASNREGDWTFYSTMVLWYYGMWTLEPTEQYATRTRQYEKKHPLELTAVQVNQATYLAALEAGAKPLQIKFGFIHVEQHGVVAVDQKRGGGKLAQTRLYLYPDVTDRVLYQITIGDKNTQQKDIQFCNWFVAELRKRKEKEHDSVKGEARDGGRKKEISECSGDGPRPV
jgi:hypothetical protein